MRHRGGTLLPFPERLLRLAHLGALQMTDLDGELFQRGADERDCPEVLGVAVALHDLRSDGIRSEPEGAHRRFLDGGRQMRERADRSGNLSVRDHRAGRLHARTRPRQLLHPPEQLPTERSRLRMDAMRSADHRRPLVLERPLQHRLARTIDAGEDQVGGIPEQDRQRRVEHVGAGHAEMEVARRGPDALFQKSEEGDHVVTGGLLDVVDARGVLRGERPCLACALLDRLAGHEARVRHRARGGQLDLEPRLIAVLRRPQAHHLGPAVAGNHAAGVPAVRPARNRCSDLAAQENDQQCDGDDDDDEPHQVANSASCRGRTNARASPAASSMGGRARACVARCSAARLPCNSRTASASRRACAGVLLCSDRCASTRCRRPR